MFIFPSRKDCFDEKGVYSETKFLEICQYLVGIHEEAGKTDHSLRQSGSVTVWPDSKACLGEDGQISDKKFKEEFARLNPGRQLPD